MEQEKKGKKIWLVVAIVLFAAALILDALWLRRYMVREQAQNQREDLSEIVNSIEENINIILEKA